MTLIDLYAALLRIGINPHGPRGHTNHDPELMAWGETLADRRRDNEELR